MSTPQQPQYGNGYGANPGYGAPQPGPPPGYPQQPPQPGPQRPGAYGQPAYGAPPPPQFGAPQQAPYGYGGPGGMPPIPPKSGTAKVWGILGAIAGVLVIGTLVSLGVFRGGTSGGTGTSAGPKYKITVPRTLVGGEYKLSKDISQQAGSSVPTDGSNSHGMKTAGGQYTSGTKSMVMLGIYGTIDDPDLAVDHTLQGMTEDGKTEVAVEEKEFTPSGGGKPLTCGVDVRQEMGQKITLAFCVWADSSTSGNVAETDAAELSKDPASVDLQALADKAGKIRTEVTAPLG
ncbi:hypothetical protein QOM21_18690 [Streptomyces sp. Pv4-95]|uniref:hypothetical protein n=1 Tax=Streptomyces sp. Pv4-95 TaxID=3049543 RepID=UPI00389147A2